MKKLAPNSMLDSVFRKIDWAVDKLGVPLWVAENELKHFKIRELTADKIRVRLDDGTYHSFSATVVLHCNPYTSRKYPYKGGLRLSSTVTPDLLRMLAAHMTFKEALVDLEFGGAKSGIILKKPANQYSPQELFRIVEGYAVEFIANFPIISPKYYVPATDIGSTAEHMDIIHNKYWEIHNGNLSNGTPVTGCSVANGGLPLREEATGLGGLIVLKHVLKKNETDFASPPKVIVHGLGQVGGHFAKQAAKNGFLIVGVANINGGVFNQNGIDLKDLPENINASLENISGEHITSEEILFQPCDILVAAAMENTLNETNAERVKAKIILELANNPVSDEADLILDQKGVLIIPDILANAGGVFVSFEEWALSFAAPRHEIDIDEINRAVAKKLETEMKTATDKVLYMAQKHKVNLRDGAWLKAVQRVSEPLIKKHGGWGS